MTVTRSTSDKTAITSGAAGDVVFNGNTINFTDLSGGSLATGDYILFSSDATGTYLGLTVNGSDIITSGLTIGSGLTGYTADLETSANGQNILLDITASPVPEPSTFALGALGIGGLVVSRKFRRRN